MSRTNDISSDNFYTKSRGQRKAWPEGCIWPEPVWDSIWGGNYWDVEDADLMKTDKNNISATALKHRSARKMNAAVIE